MKRRIAGAALFGLGLLCLVLAGALAWMIVPMERKIPFDLEPPDVAVVAAQATFLQAKVESGGEPRVAIEQAELRATTGIRPDFDAAAELTGDLAERTLVWNVYQAIDRTDTNEPISRSESRIALDRESGAAVDWSGQCFNDEKESSCQPGNISYSGQLYLFPFDTQKKTYEYFDSTLKEALPMQYSGEEKYNGLPTYRFEQTVPQQDVTMDEELVHGVLGFLAPGAKDGTATYQASRTLWVEPTTGAIVGIREQQHRELVPDVGAPIVLLDATFEYDPASLAAVRAEAEHGRTLLRLLGLYVPIGLLLVGLIAIGFAVLVIRRAATGRPPVTDDVSEPEPTPVTQA